MMPRKNLRRIDYVNDLGHNSRVVDVLHQDNNLVVVKFLGINKSHSLKVDNVKKMEVV